MTQVNPLLEPGPNLLTVFNHQPDGISIARTLTRPNMLPRTHNHIHSLGVTHMHARTRKSPCWRAQKTPRLFLSVSCLFRTKKIAAETFCPLSLSLSLSLSVYVCLSVCLSLSSSSCIQPLPDHLEAMRKTITARTEQDRDRERAFLWESEREENEHQPCLFFKMIRTQLCSTFSSSFRIASVSRWPTKFKMSQLPSFK